MERQLDEKMDNIMTKPGVVGAMCVDKRGLCLSAKGVAIPSMGGVLSSLADQARKLDATSNQNSSPVIRLQSDQGYCVVQKKGDVTLDDIGRNTPSPTRLSPSPPPLPGWDSSSSSDEAEMAGSPKRTRAERRKPDQLLTGSVKSASYNIVFQVLTRIFTFALNAFILRYVSHSVLGVCNVRLALLYSSVMFLSREPFRRACLRKKETDNWTETINLIWIVVPNTGLWSLIFGYLWCYVLSNPGPSFDSEVAIQYRSSVWLLVLTLIIDSFTEVPYIVGQYFQFSKLRIVGDTTLILVRSLFLCSAVLFQPSNAIWAYAVGTFWAVIVVGVIYYAYFYYHITTLGKRDLPFTSLKDFLPNYSKEKVEFPWELATLSWSFFKQGILKQILTEGERYLMTFFDILAFDEQGVYDLVANLGSLAARFVFLPVEESAYFYFAQTLERRESFSRRDRKLGLATAEVLGNLVKMMVTIGCVMIVYGIPYSNTLLYLYGGDKLSETGPATKLLQANCAYIFIMAVNGVTEAFTFAAMTQAQLDKFNKRLVLFSILFLAASYIFTTLFGAVGFFLANSINMALRIAQSVMLIRNVFIYCDINPFEYWKLDKRVALFFAGAFLVLNMFSWFLYTNRLVHVGFGLLIFAGNCLSIYLWDKELIQFFVKIFKSKSV